MNIMKLVKLPVCIKTLIYQTPTVNFLYPSVYGLKNYIVQNRINCCIQSLMCRIILDLPHLDLTTYITGSYEIKTNERNILSLSLIGMGEFGGAHPKTTIKSLTTDIKTGKVYELNNLFKPNSNYIEIISEIIAQQIDERNILVLNGFDKIRPNQDYYIADKSIVIYFQQYEIAPYSEGFPYFVIPVYDLETIICENGPLEKMIAFF